MYMSMRLVEARLEKSPKMIFFLSEVTGKGDATRVLVLEQSLCQHKFVIVLTVVVILLCCV